ncbi:MAG: VTT domain-containing protein [Rhodoferax sp.]|nr:VTT domain-containing protein [Rhodoferax sp.]MCB2031812.1 VTT domain-containing protein [Rhodoferax sp.]MCB2040422.1 VTT domain-containing protein [Rhodoferax sp.]MCP5262752.1 VTT domain-containing protein [Rhodoferax sp.]
MTADELLAWIATYDHWVYALLLAYALAKTGPLPMVAGFVSASGALQAPVVFAVVLAGTVAGSQLRFFVGRGGAPWLFERFTGLAPWLALGAVGVERYRLLLLPLYRFSKGTYSLVGLGAGASRLPWRRFVMLDGAGAVLWAGTSVSLGFAIGQLGHAVDPRWAAYAGLGLLALGMVTVAAFGARLKRRLLPMANEALRAARARRAQAAMAG